MTWDKGGLSKIRFSKSALGLDSLGFEDLGVSFGLERLENNKDYRVSKGKGKSVWQRIMTFQPYNLSIKHSTSMKGRL